MKQSRGGGRRGCPPLIGDEPASGGRGVRLGLETNPPREVGVSAPPWAGDEPAPDGWGVRPGLATNPPRGRQGRFRAACFGFCAFCIFRVCLAGAFWYFKECERFP